MGPIWRVSSRACFPALSLLAVALSSGCHDATAPDTPWLRIEPTASAFAPGALVTATLRNAGTFDIELDGCFPDLQRFEAERWKEVVVPPRANCGQTALVVEPGGEHSIGIDFLPDDLGPGTYRYQFHRGFVRTRPETPLTGSSLASSPFLVSPQSRGATHPSS